MDQSAFWSARIGSSRKVRHPRVLSVERLEDRTLLAALSGDLLRTSVQVATLKGGAALVAGVSAKSGVAAALVDDKYENNDTQATATNLGTITATKGLTGLVMADAADWYRFSTTSTGTNGDSVTLAFQHSQGDLDMVLYNANGQSLASSTGVTNSEAISLSGRSAGTYYVRVYGYRGVTNPNYALSIDKAAAPPAPPDDNYENNDTLATAANLGSLTAAATYSNLVMADASDYYSFTMNGAGTSANYVRITFTHSQGDLDLELYNSAGSRVGSSTGTTGTEQISLSGLAAGTYRVRVYGYQGALNPNYALTVNPGVAVAPPPSSGGFNIQFTFSGLSASEQAIFRQAAARWEAVITGDLPNATYNGIAVDDILIDASAVAIDGRGGVLGQAGPDRFRSGSSLPYHGVMQFDSADMASMISNGTFLGVILHEMGHVLGIGTLWTTKGLLSGRGGSNPIFTGVQATAEYNSLFGTTARGVPVENTGGSGTRDAHWRETVFGNELMTGWVGPGNELPMSRITIASLADLGYTVNLAAADSYVPPAGALQAGGSGGGLASVLAGPVQLPDLEPLTLSRRALERAADLVFTNPRLLRSLFD